MIIVVSSGKVVLFTKLKGGAGCTTAVREIACAAVLDNKKVALVDLDGQGSLTRWWSLRSKGIDQTTDDINPQLLEIPADTFAAAAKSLRRTYDLTIIDSPPSVSGAIKAVAASCDLAVIPCRPTADDLAAVGPIARLLKGTVDFVFLLSQVPAGGRSRDGTEALELLAQRGAVIGTMTQRTDYYRPAAVGSTGIERGRVAPAEVIRIYENLVERILT